MSQERVLKFGVAGRGGGGGGIRRFTVSMYIYNKINYEVFLNNPFTFLNMYTENASHQISFPVATKTKPNRLLVV